MQEVTDSTPRKRRKIERSLVMGSRYLTLGAVLGSLAGSLLMFVLGLMNVYSAVYHGISAGFVPFGEASASTEIAAIINVVEALDRFLIAIVLLYFAYGVYSLFIHPEQQPAEAQNDYALPAWLQVSQIGQLKQVVAEVIIVVLFVLFLRVALQAFHDNWEFSWRQIATLGLLPISTLALAGALKLVQLHPKPEKPRDEAE